MPAPLGNTNASKDNRLFGDALRRAIVQDESKRLREGMEKLLDKVAAGDLSAIALIAERTDGKAHQSIDLRGDLTTRKASDLSDDELAAIANASRSAQT